MKPKPKSEPLNDRWTAGIGKFGYAGIPNTLFIFQGKLGISNPELHVLVVLISFRHTSELPFLKMATIAERSNLDPRTVRDHISSLEDKGYLLRLYQTGYVNLYDLSPLVEKLDSLAKNHRPSGENQPPSEVDDGQGDWRDPSVIKDVSKSGVQKVSFQNQVTTKSQKRQYAIAMEREREQKARANKAATRKGGGLESARATIAQIKTKHLKREKKP